MKSSISIALIVCGTFLILSPAAIKILQDQQVIGILREQPITFSVGQSMGPLFSIACMTIGSAMIGVTTYVSVRIAVDSRARNDFSVAEAIAPTASAQIPVAIPITVAILLLPFWIPLKIVRTLWQPKLATVS